jgi:hypothetical protein
VTALPVVNAVMAEKDAAKTLGDLIASVPVLAVAGGDRRSEDYRVYINQGDDGTLKPTRGSNSTTYLASRFKRAA